MKNETVSQYLEYVRAMLKTLNQADAKASYNTGYGLHITNEFLGNEVHILDVMATSLVKIRPPNIEDFDTWESAWNQGKALVNGFTKS